MAATSNGSDINGGGDGHAAGRVGSDAPVIRMTKRR